MGMFDNLFKPINEFDVGNGEEADTFDSTGEEDITPATASAGTDDQTDDNPTPTDDISDSDENVDFTDDTDADDNTVGDQDTGDDDTDVDYTLDDTDTEEENAEDGDDSADSTDGEEDEDVEGEDDSNVDFTDDGSEEGEEGIDNTDDDIEDSGDSNDPFTGLKDIERELFDNLTDEQKNIKIKELKQNFADLHERCDGIIEILNNTTPSDESTVRVFDYIQKTLIDLQNNVRDYLTYTFTTKTFIKNDAQFKSYLVILNTIQNILEEIDIQK